MRIMNLLFVILICFASCTDNSNYGAWEDDGFGNQMREDHQLKSNLSGTSLENYSSYSSGSSGGTESSTKITLCSNGRFEFYSQTVTVINVDGMGGTSPSQESFQGTWKLVENKNGEKFLVFLSDQTGKPGFVNIKLEGSVLQWWNEKKWVKYQVKKVDC